MSKQHQKSMLAIACSAKYCNGVEYIFYSASSSRVSQDTIRSRTSSRAVHKAPSIKSQSASMPTSLLITLKLRTAWYCQYLICYGNILFNEQMYEKATISFFSKPSYMSYNICIFISLSLFFM